MGTETGEGIEKLAKAGAIRQPERGTAVVQVVPSGPLVQDESIEQILLMAIYAARRELVLTTPYFVPDEAMLTALSSAARRWPSRSWCPRTSIRGWFVWPAGHAGDLVAAGVQVVYFCDGLLHTKSITVDGEFGLFGSLNLDPRSLYLNFEITLAIFDRTFIADLRRFSNRISTARNRWI